MPNMRGVLVLGLVGCLVVAGSAYQTWRFEQRAIELQSNEDRLARQFSTLDMAVAEIRASQAAYVAAGQGPDFWMAKFDDLTGQVEAILSELQSTGQVDAAPALTAAGAQLKALRVSDGRARNYIRNEQRLLASDVIFVESLEVLGRLSAELATARDTSVLAARQQAATLRQYELALAGGALLVLLGLIVVPGIRGSGVPKVPEVPEVREVQGSEVREVKGPEVQGPGSGVQGPVLNIGDAADVCVDLARLLDGRDLPALLARAATAIGAKGLVLWVIDEPRETLRPSLSHGYSDRMVQRLGTLDVGADNVTSVACRTLQPQVVPATSTQASGALAVPLIGPSGCVGVLAAEVTGQAGDGSTLPLARVIAAQLAAVITPVPAAATVTDAPPASRVAES